MELSPVTRVSSLSKDKFRSRFKQPHRPVVIERLTESRPARERWTLDYLRKVAGQIEVPLYDGQTRAREYQ